MISMYASAVVKLDDDMLSAVSGGTRRRRYSVSQRVKQEFTAGNVSLDFGSHNSLSGVSLFVGNQASVSAGSEE